jgi:hypothetical protein
MPQESHSSIDIEVWDEAPDVVALTREAIYAKRFDTIAGRERAVEQLYAGVDPQSAMGLLTKTVQFDALRSAAVVSDMGVLVVQGSRLSDPLRVKLANTNTARQIFERLQKRLREYPRGEWTVQTGKAGANDVPFDPQLLFAVIFVIVGIMGLVMGATEGVPDEGFIIAIAFAWLGDLLGQTGSFILAALAIAAAAFLTFRWLKGLPPKLFMRRE